MTLYNPGEAPINLTEPRWQVIRHNIGWYHVEGDKYVVDDNDLEILVASGISHLEATKLAETLSVVEEVMES